MIDVTMADKDTSSKIDVDVGDVGVEDGVSDGRGNSFTNSLLDGITGLFAHCYISYCY